MFVFSALSFALVPAAGPSLFDLPRGQGVAAVVFHVVPMPFTRMKRTWCIGSVPASAPTDPGWAPGWTCSVIQPFSTQLSIHFLKGVGQVGAVGVQPHPAGAR